MNLKSHWKAISILVVIIIVVSSTLVVLAQPIKVRTIYPAHNAGVGTINSSYKYAGFGYSFYSSNSVLMSGWINGTIVASNGSKVQEYSVYLLTSQQVLEWANEPASSIHTYFSLILLLHTTFQTIIATNTTPPSWAYSNQAVGNLSVTLKLKPDTEYVLLFTTLSSNVKSFLIDFNFSLYQVYLRI